MLFLLVDSLISAQMEEAVRICVVTIEEKKHGKSLKEPIKDVETGYLAMHIERILLTDE